LSVKEELHPLGMGEVLLFIEQFIDRIVRSCNFSESRTLIGVRGDNMKPSTLDEVYRKYMMDIYRYLRLLCRDDATAEDLVQETFYRAYIHLENYKDENVKPWLFRVAYNAFIDMLRKENRSVVRENTFFHGLADSSASRPEAQVLRKEAMEEVDEWISVLPDLQKQALLLFDMNHFSYQEAANIMGVTLSYFKILLFRARQELRRNRERSDEVE